MSDVDPNLVEIARLQIERDRLRVALTEALNGWADWIGDATAEVDAAAEVDADRIAEMRKLVTP